MSGLSEVVHWNVGSDLGQGQCHSDSGQMAKKWPESSNIHSTIESYSQNNDCTVGFGRGNTTHFALDTLTRPHTF